MPIDLDAASVVDEGPHWTIAVNRNQNLLGKVMLVARRPVEAVPDLDPAEWADVRREIGRVCAALDDLFRPDLYNHAFLMNVDAQVHLHVVPRYRGPRQWGGLVFTDPHFGSLFGTEQQLIDAEQQAALAAEIRVHLPRRE
jgi:diadenosine tetraphosphate (Ap4A) HIT family hydrolase